MLAQAFMMATLNLSNALGGTGAADAPEIDVLFVLTIFLAALGLVVLIGIAVSNWRAARTLKETRQNWARDVPASGRRLIGERTVKPNPMRK